MLGSKQIGYGCSWVPGSDSGRFERVQSDFNGTSGGFVLSLPKENDLLENLDDNLLGSGYSSLESHLIGNSMVHLAREDSQDHHMKLVGDTEPRLEGIARKVGIGVRGKRKNRLRGRKSEGKGASFGVGEIEKLECGAATGGLGVDLRGSMGPDTSTLEEGDWGAALIQDAMVATVEGKVGGEIRLALPGRKLRAYELPHQDDPVQEKKRNDAIRAARNRLKKEKELEDLAAQLEELQAEKALMKKQKIAEMRVIEELERELTRVIHTNCADTSSSFSSPAASHESYSPDSSISASPTSNHSQFSDSSNLYPSALESPDMYYQSSPPSNMDAHPSQASNILPSPPQSLNMHAQYFQLSNMYGQSLQPSTITPPSIHSTPLH